MKKTRHQRLSRPKLLPPIRRCDRQYRFDPAMWAGTVRIDGKPQVKPSPPLRDVIALLPFKRGLAKQKSGVISFVFAAPDDLLPGLPIGPSCAVDAVREALARAKAVLLMAASQATLTQMIGLIAKTL